MNQGREVSSGTWKLLKCLSGRFLSENPTRKTKNYVRDKKKYWQLLSGPWFWSLIYSHVSGRQRGSWAKLKKGSRLDGKIIVASKIIECAMNLVKLRLTVEETHFITRWLESLATVDAKQGFNFFLLNFCSLTRFRGAPMIYAVHAYLLSPHFNPSREAHDSAYSSEMSPKKMQTASIPPGCAKISPETFYKLAGEGKVRKQVISSSWRVNLILAATALSL